MSGFYLYGNISTEEIESAANEALQRMQNGEHGLAVHPNCGTGLVTAGVLTSLAAFAGTTGMKHTFADRISRLPTVILLSILSLIVSQPIGLSLQQHFTTLGEPGNLEIVNISRHEFPMPLAGQRMTVHFVKTTHG